MLQFHNLSKSYSDQVLFSEASFAISPGDKIGLIGRNGAGKSTLFKIILNEESYDDGQIQVPKNYKIATLKQHLSFTKETILEEVVEVMEDEDKVNVYKAEKILTGLGFTESDFQKAPSAFSGGFQIRLNLAKCLLQNPNLLLLDEPTNYLDIVSMRWLKRFLVNFPGEVILITHDREFLDSVSTHILGIHRQKLKKIKGSTSKYFELIEQEEELYEQTRVNNLKKKKELEDFVTRFKAKASKATQAASRVKALEKMEDMDELSKIQNMNLRFSYKPIESKSLLDCEEVAFGYQSDASLFSKLSFKVAKNDRIAIIGKNGKGKSTLLRLIAGETTPSTGAISYHSKLTMGYFGQTNISRLSENNSLIEEVHQSAPKLTQTQVRSILGSLMFPGELAEKKISVLSGGEKSRVMLAKIIAAPCNLLLLDEPTNHLDMDSIEVMVDEISHFPGSCIFVTHNEMMLNKLANRIIYFQGGNAHLFEGNYEEFLEKIGWEEEKEIKSVSEDKPKTSGSKHQLSRHERAQLVKERARLTKPLKKKIEQLENTIHQAEVDLEKEKVDLMMATEKMDNESILKTSQNIERLNKLIDESFLELESESEKLVFIEDKFTE